MAYVKNTWVDREGTTRYFETVDDDGALILTPDYTQVTEMGTPVNADNMNHIEDGIAAMSFSKYDSATTYALNDLVTVIEDASPVIYKSLQENNIGNDLLDTTYWEKISLGGGGGLEIGDIGFTQMAIDESKGKRRILNGSVIIQEQYPQFTNIVKNSVALNADLACTEDEWQTAVTMSEAGICYKFVIDDEAGTIRLPKYPSNFIGGVNGIAPVVGNGMTLGLTTGVQNVGLVTSTNSEKNPLVSTSVYGLPFSSVGSIVAGTSDHISYGVTTDPAKSGIEAQIKQEKIKGTYFIQVATGAETEDNIINEIELNNPFSLLDYKYSEYELNNLSWLRSNGQYNSKAIYPAVYDLLLKIYNGTETKAGVSVKLTTETFTDYDFVLNTAEETFRLPVSVTNSAKGYLYFYVGETVQNANLINAGRIEEKIAGIVPNNSSLIASYGMPSNKYVDLTLGASGTTYTAPANGWFMLSKIAGSDWYYTNIVVLIDGVSTNHLLGSFSGGYRTSPCNNLIPVKKGDIVEVIYNATGATQQFRFIYAEGEV